MTTASTVPVKVTLRSVVLSNGSFAITIVAPESCLIELIFSPPFPITLPVNTTGNNKMNTNASGLEVFSSLF